ncbi:MAG: class I SAM-dependent methyltransferase, partial [Verrucomicrobiia bacterium]
MYKTITRCRISGSSDLITVISLGEQHLTGVFPKTKDEVVTKGPLDVAWCPTSSLLQLRHSYDPNEMYGE